MEIVSIYSSVEHKYYFYTMKVNGVQCYFRAFSIVLAKKVHQNIFCSLQKKKKVFFHKFVIA